MFALRRFSPILRHSIEAASLFPQRRWGSNRNKVVTLEDAVQLVRSGCTLTVGGFGTQNCAEYILKGLEKRFLETGEPNNMTLIFEAGPGDYATRGLNHLARPGMLKRAIGAHYSQAPMIGELAQKGLIEAYEFPFGAISRMIRCAASKQPGHLTEIGFGTLADPKIMGGKLNSRTTEDLVHEVEVLGKKYLLYQAVPIDVAIIRGTTADADGNISFELESLYADNVIQAMAAHSTRGVVIAQVARIAANGSLTQRNVKVPSSLVSCVVESPPEDHWMSFVTQHNPAATGEIRSPKKFSAMPFDERKVIARRAALELVPNQVANLGIGMSQGIADVCAEEQVMPFLVLTTEPGVHGGIGMLGQDFGPAENYDALLETHMQFDYINGGGLDVAFLSFGQVNELGDVNVTRLGPKITGPGGFIDISQCTQQVYFLGSFTAKGLKVECRDGKLVILNEGAEKKFVKEVAEVCFSGPIGVQRKQNVLYITERCVFELGSDGLELVEIAPGIDLQSQILDLMEFKPSIRDPLPLMNPSIFQPQIMGLRNLNFVNSPDNRLFYDPEHNTLFCNLEDVSITHSEEIEMMEKLMHDFIENTTQGKKVHFVANYENFDCVPELVQSYEQMSARLQRDVFLTHRRYASSTFARQKLAYAMGVRVGGPLDLEAVCALVKTRGISLSREAVGNLFRKYDHNHDNLLSSGEAEELMEALRRISHSS